MRDIFSISRCRTAINAFGGFMGCGNAHRFIGSLSKTAVCASTIGKYPVVNLIIFINQLVEIGIIEVNV